MYVVYKAYDDNTAEIYDIGTYQKRYMTEQELISFGSKHDVLGLSTTGGKINYINAYNCLNFPTEDDANEYIKENGLSYKNKVHAMDYYWVFEKKNITIHVDYYVCTWAGESQTFIGENGGYTPYIQAAKSFTKHEAGKKAALMTRNSKTGKKWTTHRIPIN